MVLKRVRAGPAVTPPAAKAARMGMGKKSIVCARQPRAWNGAACVQKNSACPKHTMRQKSARALPEAPLPQASSVAPRLPSAPCPRGQGSAASPASFTSGFPPSPPEIPSALTLCPCRRQTMPPDTPISFKRKNSCALKSSSHARTPHAGAHGEIFLIRKDAPGTGHAYAISALHT